VNTISIDKPTVKPAVPKGDPIAQGGVVLRGRAVEKLIQDLPRKPWQEFTECPYEELEEPKRIHVDVFGNAQLCQGLSMGNMWKIPLSQLVQTYIGNQHPICKPLIQGGPARLAQEYQLEHEEAYVDACHFCFLLRKALISAFPDYLAPRLVYGLE
jgi:hypothetical protein